MKRYFCKCYFIAKNGAQVGSIFGRSNDRFTAERLTPKRIAKCGYITREGAERNYYYNAYKANGLHAEIMEFDV